MELSPRLYHWLVRPKWFTNLFINTTLKSLLNDFDFKNKFVLDFGCGIGSNCTMFDPQSYTGIDYDDKRVKYANYLYKEYHFSTLSRSVLDFSDNSVDYIFIMAVLHHISSDEMKGYLKEFYRVLKANGKILVIEPCFFNKALLSNNCMKTFDRGNYIRTENEYLRLFHNNDYETIVLKKFKKCLYNEIFFTASPKAK